MNDIRMKNNVLKNKNFKYFVYIVTLLTGVALVVFGSAISLGLVAVFGAAMMNLGYIQEERDSSKVDF